MDSIVETFQHCGYDIEIHYDQDAQSPDEWKDTGLFLITTRNRYFEVQRDGFTLDGCRDGEYSDYECFPLFAYIHSGVALSLGRGGQFSDQWDSGQIGYVLVGKTEGIPDAHKAAEGLVSEWNSYLSGEVYGYIVDPDGPHEDSCWGFVGDIEYCKTEAKSVTQSIFDREVKENAKIEQMMHI